MQILQLLISLACLVCFIVVLIKQFQVGGVVHGIIGIITCSLWTFIWGWINSGKAGVRNIMLIWTVLIIVAIILAVVTGGFHYSFNVGTTS
ncbi:MAG TPA: hypothetical protein VKF81_15080 [Blastocatellia bacterium]|nr:hypothetical protein [Blastocatellia bacterium]